MSVASTILAVKWNNAPATKKRAITAIAKRELSVAEFKDFMKVRAQQVRSGKKADKEHREGILREERLKYLNRPRRTSKPYRSNPVLRKTARVIPKRRAKVRKKARHGPCFCIAASVKTGRKIYTYFWTGRAFVDQKQYARKYASEKSAGSVMMKMAGRLPATIKHLVVKRCSM